jgi:extradiol dioxygenase family protein
MGAAEGRSTDTWVDFDFFGHQLSLHLGTPFATANTGKVGEHMVPMPHFGIVLGLADWKVLAKRLQEAGVDFVIPPSVRFEGQPGEQWTMFFRDYSGNPIEVKGFADTTGIFAA